MPIQVQCPNPQCRTTLQCPDETAGKVVLCSVCGAQVQVPQAVAPKSQPQTLGGYQIVRKLGQGGMGAVFEAIQTKLERKIALKVLPLKLTRDPEYLERFQREAKAAAALNHPNIIQVYDIGDDKGSHFFAMEFVDGQSLQDRLKREGKVPLEDALRMVGDVAKALQYAHSLGIIHRDIKPDNIMVNRQGQVKLADLGLAKRTEAEKGLTQTGAAMGTPYYMAPEQAEDARSVDHRADIYSLGITLLYLLTGKRPFDGDSAYSIILKHVQKPLPTGEELGTKLPPAVDSVIQRMCAKDRTQRYPDYDSLLADLERAKSEAFQPAVRPHAVALGTQPVPSGASGVPLAESHRQPSTGVDRSAPTVPGKRPRRLPNKGKSPLLVGLRVAVALLAIVSVFLALGRGDKRPTVQSPRQTKPTPAKAQERSVSTTSVRPEPPPAKTGLWDRMTEGFEIPKEPKDKHGNPIRAGSDAKTGLPLEIRHKATGMHFVFIPAGEFMMGSPDTEKDRQPDEGPVHKVRVPKPFYLGKYEVTQAEWTKVMGRNPSLFKGDTSPVENVSWTDCQEFMEKLDEAVGGSSSGAGIGMGVAPPSGAQGAQQAAPLRFALPTEAQWEYACRAGTTTRFSYGDDKDYSKFGEYGWHLGNSGRTMHPVGEKKPNAWGLYDMHGNVWEWCQAGTRGSYVGASEDASFPENDANKATLMMRGGSWGVYPRHCRAASRGWLDPGQGKSDSHWGLRCMLRAFEADELLSKAGTRPHEGQPSGSQTPSVAPPPFDMGFEVAMESKDAHGNSTRQGKDSKTGRPLEIRHKATGMHFVFILAGEFMMGSPDKEKDRSATEGPVHKVTISKPFYMGKYEVTQAEWTKAMGNNPSKFKGDNNPVEWISWNDCQEFLKKLNEGVGSKALERLGGPQRGAEAPHHELEFALPTEAQWEYACRARATTRFSYGDDPNYSELGDYAWFDGNSGEEAHAVGQKKPSPWGLYDMHGNLWEWCEDQYRVNYEGAPTDGSAAANDANDGSRVMRGGTWCGGPMACRSACRDCRPPAFRGSAVGLRCVLRDF